MNDQSTEQKLELPQEVRAFLDSLLEDGNMSFTDETQHEEMIQELYARLDYFLTSRIIEAIPPENLEEFTKLNEDGKDREEVERFLTDHIPDAQIVMQNAFSEFRNLYLGNVNVQRDASSEESNAQDQKND